MMVKQYTPHRFSTWKFYNVNIDALIFLITFSVYSVTWSFTLPRTDFAWEDLVRRELIKSLNHTRALNATDARDRIFALFGVLSAVKVKLDEPDYRDSTGKVFFKFTRRLIQWHGSLDILIEASKPARTDTPSWVPDWSRRYIRGDVYEHKAAGNSVPRYFLGEHFLETSGKVLDRVDTCSHEPLGELGVTF